MKPFNDGAFRKAFGHEPAKHFVSYGRLEILGTHTDHNHGLCLVGGCSLGISASVSKRQDGIIAIKSDGYRKFKVNIGDSEKRKSEEFTSIALTRGVVDAFKKRGYKVGGFEATMESDIFAGAGVSSSAAFELMVAEVLNALYNENRIGRMELAKIGQYAENVYFGKASGLLDQTGSSFAGIQYLDFRNIDEPVVESLSLPREWGLHIVLINPGQSHASLSDLYGTIPADMKKEAAKLGKEFLREVEPKAFYGSIVGMKEPLPLSTRRAIHFYEENERVRKAKKAIAEKDLESFLDCIRGTMESCEHNLENTYVQGMYEDSPSDAVKKATAHIGGGAARSMGGGFAGSIICFVKDGDFAAFMNEMKKIYGDERVVEVSIPEKGAHEVYR